MERCAQRADVMLLHPVWYFWFREFTVDFAQFSMYLLLMRPQTLLDVCISSPDVQTCQHSQFHLFSRRNVSGAMCFVQPGVGPFCGCWSCHPEIASHCPWGLPVFPLCRIPWFPVSSVSCLSESSSSFLRTAGTRDVHFPRLYTRKRQCPE